MEIDTQSKPEPECHQKEDQEQQQQQQQQQRPREQPSQQQHKPDVHIDKDDDDDDEQGQSTWVAYLETERNRRFDPVDSSFMSIFRDLLRSNAVHAAHDAAHAIDQAFADGWLPQRSMLKHGGDEGLADFVHLVYNLIFELAPLLAHDSAQHVRLFELLVELRKLPPRSFKLNSNEYIPYINDPDFFDVLHEETRNCYPDDPEDTSSAAFREQCEAWVNFCMFKARCVEAGILDQRTNPYGLPADQIVEGLETDPLPAAQAVRDCKVLIAAHYLAVAGEKFHERLILVPPPRLQQQHQHQHQGRRRHCPPPRPRPLVALGRPPRVPRAARRPERACRRDTPDGPAEGRRPGAGLVPGHGHAAVGRPKVIIHDLREEAGG
ncbi:hypothetical protein PG991_011423 [Apiospora marii]|uniref:Uncharacterized protein n=1 Tax=Apiospora marii TaxID=335849 RepID=A0ABR1RE53_9PEZI